MEFLNLTRTEMIPESFTEYLKAEAPNWLASVNEKQLEYFYIWVCHTGAYRRSKHDPDWVKGDTISALRGFVKGLEFDKKGN